MKNNSIYWCGQFLETEDQIIVYNPFNQEKKTCGKATVKDIQTCIDKTLNNIKNVTSQSTFAKKEILKQIVEGIVSRKQEFIDTIIFESAKPYVYAKGEVERAIQTFKVAIEEVGRIEGEVMDLGWTATGEGKKGIIERFPIGIVAGISPFNFPLNLVAHKVAPAIAAGCPIILKPASKTPLTALLLAEVIHESNLPDIGFSVVPSDRESGNILVTSEKINLLSFTGSPEVGWAMKKDAGKKKVVLELGGNAAAIVHKDADIKHALKKLIIGGFAYSGQVCIHTQRIVVHEAIYDSFKKLFIEQIELLKAGNPQDRSTDYSSIISQNHVERINNWVDEALEEGATLLTKRYTKNNTIAPILLEKVDIKIKVYAEEVFGPVVCIESYKNIDEAISKVNNTTFGLQASIFSDSHSVIQKCFRNLEVGGVIVNEATTFRVDHMPYGGIKDSGLGREGVKYAIEDMTEIKILVHS